MAVLNDVIRAFIVRGLACFDTPSTVAKDVEAEFGIKIDRDQVRQYSPDWPGRPPAKRWLKMHTEIRKAFVEEQAGIAIASMSMRLRRLERVLTKAETIGNPDMVMRALEQAAKEVGGAFTNKHLHAGADGGPIGVEIVRFTDAAAAKDKA